MTNVIYSPETYRIRAKGHAGYGDFGFDPVCAGVTALMATAMAALTEAGIDVDLSEPDAEGADIDLRAEPKMMQAGMCRTIMDTIAAGIRHVAMEHPDYVRFQRIVYSGED